MNLQNVVSAKRTRYFFVVLGAIIFGGALGLIISPNQLAPGGVSGLSVMLCKYIPIGVGTFTMLLNLPLLIFALFVFGVKFLAGTILAIAVCGVTADICSSFQPLTTNLFLAAVAGGAAMGAGCGTVFLAGATTGGTDIVAKLVVRRRPYISTGRIFLLVDGIICTLSGFVFHSFDNAMYAFVSLFVFSNVLDIILYGGDKAKLVLIISRKSDELLPALLNNARVGCTVLNGKAGFSGEKTDTMLCAMKKQTLPEVKKLVLKIDTKAFMLVGDTNEIYGEGFKTTPYN